MRIASMMLLVCGAACGPLLALDHVNALENAGGFGADQDGDGFADAEDNCVGVFNPAQPWQRRLSDLAHSVQWEGFSPDGQQVVYGAYASGLYVVPFAEGAPLLLHATPGFLNHPWGNAQITPDGARVVFFAGQVCSNCNGKLYSVPVLGGPSTDLAPDTTFPANNWSSTSKFRISTDSAYVVYFAPPEPLRQLFSVPVGGGQKVMLNPVLPPGGRIQQGFQITPDGSTVVYMATQDSASKMDLCTVPITGGHATTLSDPLSESADVTTFALSPDGSQVLYVVNPGGAAAHVLYQVAISGGPSIELASGVTTFFFPSFWISPDGTTVVYRGDQSQSNLYSVPIFGGASTPLSEPAEGSVYPPVAITPDGSTVVYVSEMSVTMHSVPIHGGTGVLLAEGPLSRPTLSPDGSSVVFLDWPYGSSPRLHSVPTAGGLPVEVGPEVYPHSPLLFNEDGSGVYYGGSSSFDPYGSIDRLDLGDLAGGTPLTLAGPLPFQDRIDTIVASADGAAVVYRARQSIAPFSSTVYTPTVSQPDHDLDALGDACDNCSQVVNAGQENADGDLAGDSCDCRVGDAAVWAAPSEARALVFTTAAQLEWEASEEPGAIEVVYDVVRSSARDDFVETISCIEPGQGDTVALDPSLPAPGAAYYYLIRARNACDANAGHASSGLPHVVGACAG